MTFTQKKIRTTLTMANGKFANGQNKVVVENLRTSCQIATTGGVSSSAMSMAIYGLPMSTMNALTNVGVKFQASYDNTVVVEAGDDESGMSTVFVGNIFAAYFDGSAMPNTCFQITAGTTSFVAQKPAPPTSTTKATDVGGLMSGLAKTMGLVAGDIELDRSATSLVTRGDKRRMGVALP